MIAAQMETASELGREEEGERLGGPQVQGSPAWPWLWRGVPRPAGRVAGWTV